MYGLWGDWDSTLSHTAWFSFLLICFNFCSNHSLVNHCMPLYIFMVQSSRANGHLLHKTMWILSVQLLFQSCIPQIPTDSGALYSDLYYLKPNVVPYSGLWPLCHKQEIVPRPTAKTIWSSLTKFLFSQCCSIYLFILLYLKTLLYVLVHFFFFKAGGLSWC